MKKYARDQTAITRNIETGKIEVRIRLNSKDGPEGEWLWAMPLDATTARILNIPFFADEPSVRDIVKTGPRRGHQCDFLHIVCRTTRAFPFEWQTAASPRATRERWKLITAHLGAEGIACESGYPGFAAGAAPVGMSVAKTVDVLDSTPWILRHGIDEEVWTKE